MSRLSQHIYVYVIAFLAICTIILGLLGWQVQRRNDVLEELRDATARVEAAATHTEQVLLEVVEARNTPEAVARDEAVVEALRQIDTILGLLCQIDDPVRADACEELHGPSTTGG